MKTRHFFMSSALLLAMAQTMVSCVYSTGKIFDEGPRVTQIRNQKGFERIEIYGSPTVYFTQADSFSVKVKGPEGAVDDVLTDVNDGTLSIRNKGKIGIVNINTSHAEIAVYVTAPDLVGVQLNGSGDFVSQKPVDTDNMQIVLRGSGNIEFKNIICDHCSTELIGSGDVDIDRLESLVSTVSLIGSGDVDVKQWNVENTDIALKGSGDISVDFVEGCRNVSCQLVGSGDISLKGRIGHFIKQKSGSGDIDTDKLMIEK